VPPIPSAKVRTAVTVNTGDSRNCLVAYRSFLPRSRICTPALGTRLRGGVFPVFCYLNLIRTISGSVPTLMGGPQVPAPLEVYTFKLPKARNP